jgi:hypothetical protein
LASTARQTLRDGGLPLPGAGAPAPAPGAVAPAPAPAVGDHTPAPAALRTYPASGLNGNVPANMSRLEFREWHVKQDIVMAAQDNTKNPPGQGPAVEHRPHEIQIFIMVRRRKLTPCRPRLRLALFVLCLLTFLEPQGASHDEHQQCQRLTLKHDVHVSNSGVNSNCRR